ncbi:MAG: carboxyl transferase domain-containing protein [Acidimicrobiales bacterium]
MSEVQIRAGMPGPSTATLTDLGGNRAVVVTVGGDSENRGALTLDCGPVISNAAELARHEQVPCVLLISSSGANIAEGIGASFGWGTAAKALAAASGVVPILACATGPVAAGPALLLGFADFVVMTEASYAFVSGPLMVEQFTGVPIGTDELGGPGVHADRSGLASFVVTDEQAAIDVIAELLLYLPPHIDAIAPTVLTDDPVDRPTPEAGAVLPTSPTGSYDVRDVIRSVVDDGILVECRARWAANIVTGLAAIGGTPVGIVANQPQILAGTLDIAASQKAARFVAFCDAFGIPLVTFVDTPGFQPGKDLEWRGMIRHGAQLAFAYARATVPRVCVTLRKSYGGAYIVMDSKYMGNDVALAWPNAEIAVMGAKGAVEILHRRTDPADRPMLEADYEARLLNPYRAADRGSVDAVIDPAETRREVAAALTVLQSKREHLVNRRHDNSPL